MTSKIVRIEYFFKTGSEFGRFITNADPVGDLKNRIIQRQVKEVKKYIDEHGISDNTNFDSLITDLFTFTTRSIAIVVAAASPDVTDEVLDLLYRRFHIHITCCVSSDALIISVFNDMLCREIKDDSEEYCKWQLFRMTNEFKLNSLH